MSDEKLAAKLAQAVIDADLPMNDKILIALGELYTREEFRGELVRMAVAAERGTPLHRVFGGGFDWEETPQGHEWWSRNVYRELQERE